MPIRNITHPPQPSGQHATAATIAAQDSRSCPRPTPTSLRTHPATPSRRPASARRPRGHVVGHALGGPPPPSFDGRPRGHVVGHALGGPPPPSFNGRPRGHVVGHGIGAAPAGLNRSRYRAAA
jgi:hypothetical protein